MKYQIDSRRYADFDVFSVNKLPPRGYFIPFPDREQADAAPLLEKRYASEKVICLNGTWDFRFYPRPAELPAEHRRSPIWSRAESLPSPRRRGRG